MHTDNKVPPPSERLTPEEVHALRSQFAGGESPDRRAYGAATLDDVAEAAGVTPDEVRLHLDRLRADRAARPPQPARKDQRGLLLLALVLLAAAYPIHLLNPRRLTTEEQTQQMEERLAEIRAHRRAHPVIHYPILIKVKTGALPPAGFSLRLKGELTDTSSDSLSGQSAPLAREALRSSLTDAIVNAYTVARAAEQAAPKPDHPLPRPQNTAWGMNVGPGPDRLAYTIGNHFGMGNTLILEPPPGFTPAQWDAEVRRRIEATVDMILQSMARSQEESLKIEPPRWGNVVMPPSGYTVSFMGRQSTGTSSTSQIVLPYDANGVARKLAWTVRQLVWRDAEPPETPFASSRIALAKKAVPAYAEVTLRGPRGNVDFRLPMTASPEYPTAADAARAADRILDAAVRKAAAQVGPVAPGGSFE